MALTERQRERLEEAKRELNVSQQFAKDARAVARAERKKAREAEKAARARERAEKRYARAKERVEKARNVNPPGRPPARVQGGKS